MGHGKETPRQKMIGMMYLVLTALLALNVSKDVLNSFVLVNNGLTKTNANYYQKNEVIYGEFDRQAVENPKKGGPWRDKAIEVKTKANALFDQMEELKREIIKKGDGEDSKALVRKNEIVADSISSKDNTDKPAEIMVGDNNDGKAFGLKANINEFRETLLGMIGDDGESVKLAIEKTLETNDPPPVEGKKEAWENEHFEHLPLIAVITILSGLQNNVRNAETEILNYLYSQIDAGSFKFNSLKAVVIPKSDYVIKGNTYEAEVFIAASDTTQNPKILIGSYKKIPREDGTEDYEMVGGYTELPVEKGIGIYKAGGSSIGNKKWGGLIVLKSPKGGADIKRPFDASYMVEEASLTVSPTNMNVFYLGLDNPVEISAGGAAAEKITATMSNGKITRVSGNKYIANPLRQGESVVRVSVEMDGVKKDMGSRPFRVRMLPTPVAKVFKKNQGGIDKASLLVAGGVEAEMENFEFAVTSKVTQFTVYAKIGGADIPLSAKGNKFTDQQLEMFRKLTKGSKLSIEDIKAALPDGSVRELPPIILKLN